MSGVVAIRRARADGLRPDPVLLVSEWADKHRRLPKKSSAEPGPWRTSRTPYLREIMDALSPTSDVEEVVFMKGAQVGGTEAILNVLGYYIDHAPGPTMFVQPTVELAKRFSRQRVDPLIEDTPRIAEKITSSSRDSGNTMLSKEYPGGQLVITGANSAVGLRSMPAQLALMDEIDGYPVDADEEGSPIGLVEARQRTFPRRKRAKVSTPTIAGRSVVEAAYEDSDQRRYYVPCPDCGEMQPLEFERLLWSKFDLQPEEAVYECRACFYRIQNHQKTEMLARGEWVPEKPERVGKVRGYHLNALYAPVGWMSWGEVAVAFTKSYKNPEKHRVFVNTVLGRVWTSRGEAPEWEGLYRRRDAYPMATAPEGVLFLTCGVDVQKDRVVYEVVGWGRDKRSWSIDFGEIPGDTADLENGPYKKLDELLERTYSHPTGADLPIQVLAIDSGYNTLVVYSWTKKKPGNRVLAVKGMEGAGSALVGAPTFVEVMKNGRKLKRGVRVWPVYGAVGKTELYGHLRLEAPLDGGPTPPGFCAFPQYGEEYFRQLTAEQLVAAKDKRGYTRLSWEPLQGRDNHALDARIYARAAANRFQMDAFTESDWRRLERSLGGVTAALRRAPQPDEMAPEQASDAPKHAPNPGRFLGRRGGWLGNRGGWLRGR